MSDGGFDEDYLQILGFLQEEQHILHGTSFTQVKPWPEAYQWENSINFS